MLLLHHNSLFLFHLLSCFALSCSSCLVLWVHVLLYHQCILFVSRHEYSDMDHNDNHWKSITLNTQMNERFRLKELRTRFEIGSRFLLVLTISTLFMLTMNYSQVSLHKTSWANSFIGKKTINQCQISWSEYMKHRLASKIRDWLERCKLFPSCSIQS